VENVAGAEAKKVKMVTEVRGSEKIVSTFTEEDRFFQWAGDRPYQCFSVAAGDLAITLPRGTSLALDPGSEHEQLFSPEEVQYLADPVAESEPIAVTGDFQEHFDIGEPEAVTQYAEELSETEKLSMRDELKEVLTRYLSVDEGYFVDLSGQAVLGVLGEEMPSEERFELIENVAEVSRKYFGEAGAIEVYDDLHSAVSNSWEMFSAQAPFFTRETSERPSAYRREELLHSEDDEFAAEESVEKGSLWQRLRKRYRF